MLNFFSMATSKFRILRMKTSILSHLLFLVVLVSSLTACNQLPDDKATVVRTRTDYPTTFVGQTVDVQFTRGKGTLWLTDVYGNNLTLVRTEGSRLVFEDPKGRFIKKHRALFEGVGVGDAPKLIDEHTFRLT